jgi:uncharacterized protein YecE (DUF72 family)
MYSWNEKQSLDWYVQNSRLNAVELNASFYRFPYPNAVKSWATKGKDPRWAIKVNRWITHTLKFSEKAFNSWKKFRKLLEPLEPNIDFYLFQLPPFMKSSFAPRIKDFIKKTKLEQRFALEVRNMTWFERKWIDWLQRSESHGYVWTAQISPLDVINTSGVIYDRMHGRYGWYTHYYSDEELQGWQPKFSRLNQARLRVL